MSSGKVRMVLAWWPELVAGGDCGVSWRLWCHVCKGLKKIMIRAFPMYYTILGDEGAATTSKVVEAEPHSCSQLRSRIRHFRMNHLRRNRS
nr:hypothetical protein [Tanacetum cinerariifolium]